MRSATRWKGRILEERLLHRTAGLLACAALLLLSLIRADGAEAAKHPFLEVFGSSSQPSFSFAEALAVTPGGEVLVVDRYAGTVTKYNPDGSAATFSALGSNVIDGAAGEDETPQGGLSFGGPSEVQIAVDRSNGAAAGDIYVTQAGAHLIDVFGSTGKYLGQLTEAEGASFGEACGVTVDESGSVYVGDFSGVIHKFSPSSNPPTSGDFVANFGGVSQPCTLAAGSGSTAGNLFVASFGGSVYKLDSSTGELQATIFEGASTTVSTEWATGNALVASGPSVRQFDVSGSTPKLITIVEDGSQSWVTGVVASTSGQLYVAHEGVSTLSVFGPLAPQAPELRSVQATNVTSTEATIGAGINPEGVSTTYIVEYGPTAGYGTATAPIQVGAGETLHQVGTNLTGLLPDSTYHFKLTATNAIGTSSSVDQTFTTFRSSTQPDICGNEAFRDGPAGRLLDCRAYELVSPVQKNNTDIIPLIEIASNPAALDQSAEEGEKLTFTTSQGFGDAQGVPYVSQYISSRSSSGWTTHSITPPQGLSVEVVNGRIELEYRLFNADLCFSALTHFTDPPLAPGAPTGVAANIYRRTNCGVEAYEALSNFPHNRGAQGTAMGLSTDGSCTVFELEKRLYESCGGVPREINVLPDGTASPEGAAGTAFGGPATVRTGNTMGAVSSDASVIYWSPQRGPAPLFVRTNASRAQSAVVAGKCTEPAKACTLPVSETVTAPGEATHFWGASSNGQIAVFSVDASASPLNENLYQFNLTTDESELIAPSVSGFLGVGRDGKRMYFVSSADLATGAVAGRPNLYFYDGSRSAGERVAFIATISNRDAERQTTQTLTPVNVEPYMKTSRVTPDGLHAVFTSTASLTGFDNTDAVSGEPDAEVYLFDATLDNGAGRLTCVSCNPAGQRPAGRNVPVENQVGSNWSAALVPPYQTELYGSRVVTNDGSRVFFNGYDAIVPGDINGKEDVYEWEALEAGTCTASSSRFVAQANGCIGLVSSGESPTDSEFIDASKDGKDLFFSTGASLVTQDPGLIDLYDARADGGYPPPPGGPPDCEGDACQGELGTPNLATPSTEAFRGRGNVTKKKCRKGQTRRHGKCTKKHSKDHKQKKHQRNRGNHGRGAK